MNSVDHHDLPGHLFMVNAAEHVASEREPPHLPGQNADAGHLSRFNVRSDAEVCEPKSVLSILRRELQKDRLALLKDDLVRAVLELFGDNMDHPFLLDTRCRFVRRESF